MIEATNNPSLKSKIIRSTTIPVHNPLMPSGSRPKEYENWDETKLQNAIQDVCEGQAVRRVALNYGIPKSTLHDKISGRVTVGGRSGSTPYLSSEEEYELVSFLNGCLLIGYAHTKKQNCSIGSMGS